MRLLVLGCGAVLALALAVILLSSGTDVLYQLIAQPQLTHIAWVFIVIVAVVVLGAALWANEKFTQQQRATEMLESRLRLEEAQRDVDRATTQLGRTVPDSAMRELQERLTRAEKELAAQQQRGDAAEFRARVEEIGTRQAALKDKLGEVITARKSVERLFLEYETTQQEIDRTLAGIEVDQKGDALDTRIANLSQFAKLTQSRLQELEQGRQLLLDLDGEFGALQERLTPLKDERGGIKARIHRFNEMSAELVASMEALERDGDVRLAERIQRIADHRRELSQRVATLADELSKLDDSHRDIHSLFGRLSHELNIRSAAGPEPAAEVARRTAAE